MNAAHKSLTKLTRGSWSLSPGTSIQFIWMAPGSHGQHGVSRSSTMTPGLLHDSPRTCHVHSHGWMTQGHKDISRFAGHEGLLLPWVSDKKRPFFFFFFLIAIIKRKLGSIQNGSAFDQVNYAAKIVVLRRTGTENTASSTFLKWVADWTFLTGCMRPSLTMMLMSAPE